jgi:phage-related protein
LEPTCLPERQAGGKKQKTQRMENQIRTWLSDNKHLFAFWDKMDKNDTVVISTHGLIKKTDKIPKSEIERAEKLREKYFNHKNKRNENI